MAHSGNGLEHSRQTVVHTNAVGLGGIADGKDILHLYMTAEADDLVADGMLEPQYHCHGDNHHR